MPQQRDARFRRRASLVEASRTRSSGALRLLPVAALGIDLIAISLALVGGAAGRNALGALFVDSGTEYVPAIAVTGPLLALAWLASIALAGGYDRSVFGAGASEYSRVFNAALVSAGVIGVGSFLLRFDLSRGWFVLTFLIGVPLLIGGRFALRHWLKKSRQAGSFQHRVLIVGDAPHVESVNNVLERESWLGYQVIGALAPESDGSQTPSGIPILGDTRDIAGTAMEAKADIVFFAGGGVTSPTHLREIAWDLEGSSTQVVVAPSLSDVSRERIRVRPVGGLPLIHLEKPRAAMAARRAKRVFDVVGSLGILILSSPLFAYSAFRVWFHDRGPVFFRQERIGRDGDPFKCFKFRTMVTDAEKKLAEAHAAAGSDSNAVFYKLKVDPRITPPGKWLRRFSIDELPQLLNVLKGDMSLVGPRPQVAHEVALYDNAMARRLHVRPGMTGLWQVSGRSDLPMEEAIRLDLYYVDNWSMMQDLTILARTLGAVVGSRGAY
ncbi:sugar transferase [Nocardioides scoriae]|uniref:sugar transferase n=1 Tax=Nocardioides scoriae TaxID=642780 RepID=UPI0012F86BD5|nr:sugar transferase [Nocardioides scoriae]